MTAYTGDKPANELCPQIQEASRGSEKPHRRALQTPGVDSGARGAENKKPGTGLSLYSERHNVYIQRMLSELRVQKP